MRNAADVPKLEEYPAAGRVHGRGDAFPAGDLLGAVNTRSARIADPLRRYLRRLGDDQSGAGALGIVGGIKRPGRIAWAGPIAGHRRHHYAIGQLKRTELEW